MLNKICFVVLAASLYCAVMQAAMADNDGNELSKVETELKDTVTDVLSVLRNEQLSREEKAERIMEIISPIFRFELMAKLTLGRRHWSQLSESQRAEFIELFMKHLRMSYIGKAERFADRKIHYMDPTWAGNEGGNRCVMNTYVLINGKKNALRYKFYKKDDEWKVYDIEIEGVSLIRSYGSQYRNQMEKGGAENLFANIRETVERQKEKEQEESDRPQGE